MGNKNLKAIDFFCSGGGMTYGFTQAGIKVLGGIDIAPEVQQTYEKNNPKSKFLLADVFSLSEKQVESSFQISKNDDDLILVGCSPCQYWSIIRTEKTKAEKSKDLLKEFHRFVKYFNPGYVVVENVPGLAKKAKESGLNAFIEDLTNRGYEVSWDVYKLNEYGVPQSRKRFSLIASRVEKRKISPKKSNYKPVVKDFIGTNNGFPKISSGHRDHTSFLHSSAGLNDENLAVIKRTPKNGGNSVKIRKNYRGKGFQDSYSRMSWEKPAPTITTKFHQFSSGRFGHPEENRAISLREGAVLQTFPKDYYFSSRNMCDVARMIGNAVPPEFAMRIGISIIN